MTDYGFFPAKSYAVGVRLELDFGGGEFAAKQTNWKTVDAATVDAMMAKTRRERGLVRTPHWTDFMIRGVGVPEIMECFAAPYSDLLERPAQWAKLTVSTCEVETEQICSFSASASYPTGDPKEWILRLATECWRELEPVHRELAA